ncbi:uncharacterized protein LOC112569512 [Pomacea canaliculata]|uniref:uncharacterized protein LOC112569512 n=1 Tax=Pomacea canaliculata TaxID=400727 RepID=UPI000D73BBAE|nr:uncharacterized protein LOC112569512 [Pomacea canaliculata]
MKLLTTSVNSFKRKRTFLLILLFAGTQSNTETECEATEGLTLKCKFPKNMESTETDFLIYFYPDNGKTELLADCSWNNKKLVCILQDSIEIKHPVSDIAVISLPPRFVRIPGTYKCIPDGVNSENSKACQFHKILKEGEEIQNKSENEVHLQKPVESLPEKNHDQEGEERSTSSIVGAVLGSVAVIVMIVLLVLLLYNKFWKKTLSTPEGGCSLSLNKDNLCKSTDYKTTDPVSATQLSRGSQPEAPSAAGHKEGKPLLQSEDNEIVAIREDASHEEYPYIFCSQPDFSQRASSALGFKEDKPLLQSENIAIRERTSHGEYSDIFRSSLKLNYKSCEGFVRENGQSIDIF